MKLKIEAVKTGDELVDSFVEELAKNNVLAKEKNTVKILVQGKNGEVEITPDKLRIVFNN